MKKKQQVPIYKKPAFYMLLFVVVCLVVTIILAKWKDGKLETGENNWQESETYFEAMQTKDDPVETEPETTEQVYTVNFLATGDNLIHSGIIKSGKKGDGTYNYDHLYKNVSDEIKSADLAIINQETIFTDDRNNYSGYPSFGGPLELADAVVNAGFDIVTHASNHAFDRGEHGIMVTLDYWKTNFPQMKVLGIARNQEERDTIQTVECNGIKFALINYTYSINGYHLPEGKDYLVNILDEQKVIADIKKAKSMSDCVIFFLHVGTEYTYTPSEDTYKWVKILLENGVDICIGGHPHVLEPYAMLTSSTGHEMLCYYSMGNFVSTQDTMRNMLGAFAKFTVQKTVKGDDVSIKVTSFDLEPTFTHYNHSTGVYTVYKLSDYSDQLCKQHGLVGTGNVTMEKINALFDQIMSIQVTQPGAAKIYQPYIENKNKAQEQQQDTTAETKPDAA